MSDEGKVWPDVAVCCSLRQSSRWQRLKWSSYTITRTWWKRTESPSSRAMGSSLPWSSQVDKPLVWANANCSVDWHTVSTQVKCEGKEACGVSLKYAHELRAGDGIVRRNGGLALAAYRRLLTWPQTCSRPLRSSAEIAGPPRFGISSRRTIVSSSTRSAQLGSSSNPPHPRSQALGIVYSTALGSIESLPFRWLFWLSPSLLAHPATRTSLAIVLESPALRAAEDLFNQLVAVMTRGGWTGLVSASRDKLTAAT
eukprot:746547-Hanusia_phi.AAC.3